MTRIAIVFLVLASAIIPLVDCQAMTAEEIVAKSWKLFRQADTERELVALAIEYRDGRKEEKQLERWTKYSSTGEDRVTIRFSKPAIDNGLSLLIWRHADGSDDVWLKLPSLNQERRISMRDQAKYFAETDFTYEDSRQLIGERIKDFNYRLVSEKDGVYIIEATPKANTESGYGKRIFHINTQWVFFRIEYYEKNGILIKVQNNGPFEIGQNGRWRPRHLEMDNVLLKRKTVMDIRERNIDQNLSSEVFSRKFLTGKK
jgi:hypothetical protein